MVSWRSWPSPTHPNLDHVDLGLFPRKLLRRAVPKEPLPNSTFHFIHATSPTSAKSPTSSTCTPRASSFTSSTFYINFKQLHLCLYHLYHLHRLYHLHELQSTSSTSYTSFTPSTSISTRFIYILYIICIICMYMTYPLRHFHYDLRRSYNVICVGISAPDF